MNDYVLRNWLDVKRVLLELVELEGAERAQRIQAIGDARLRREIQRWDTTHCGDLMEQPLVRWDKHFL